MSATPRDGRRPLRGRVGDDGLALDPSPPYFVSTTWVARSEATCSVHL